MRHSYRDWTIAQVTTSHCLSRKVKEPQTLLLFRFGIYEFFHNLDGSYSQSQMAILYDLPDINTIQSYRKFEILAAPPGLHDIEVDESLFKYGYISKGFYPVKGGIAQ